MWNAIKEQIENALNVEESKNPTDKSLSQWVEHYENILHEMKNTHWTKYEYTESDFELVERKYNYWKTRYDLYLSIVELALKENK